jgi:putative flippase GtrA
MIRKELTIFLVVGGLAVLVDYLTYSVIIWTGLLGTNLAKGAGFLTGTVLAYFANRLWTFGTLAHAEGNAWRFSALYTLTLFINIYANALILGALTAYPYPLQVAFVIATGLSATLNFFGMKYFVFVNADASRAA